MKMKQKTRAVTGMAGRLGSAGSLMGRPTCDLRVARFLFFKKSFIYFNWRLIILQYCSSSHHTSTWISHGCTCVPHPEPPSHLPPYPLPPPSLSPPSGLSQCTSPEHPVSCLKPGLAIYITYGNIHVSVLFSQIIPPSPSPTESKRLFYTSFTQDFREQ